MLHRPLIDSLEFAKSGAKVSGEWPIADFPRLQSAVRSDQGALLYKLEGVAEEQGRPALRLHVEGSLHLTCQRCLGALEHGIQLDALLLLYETERDVVAAPVEAEGPDRIVATQDMAVRDLIEEEVLLAVPYAPRHERCEGRGSIESAPPPGPFADLRSLLGTKH